MYLWNSNQCEWGECVTAPTLQYVQSATGSNGKY